MNTQGQDILRFCCCFCFIIISVFFVRMLRLMKPVFYWLKYCFLYVVILCSWSFITTLKYLELLTDSVLTKSVHWEGTAVSDRVTDYCTLAWIIMSKSNDHLPSLSRASKSSIASSRLDTAN